MADLTYAASIRVNKQNFSGSVAVSQYTASMGQAGMSSFVVSLSTAATSISTANLSTVGLAFLRNLSTATAATATIGIAAGGSFVGFCTLRAGEPAMFRMAAGTTYQAVGASGARLRVDITEG